MKAQGMTLLGLIVSCLVFTLILSIGFPVLYSIMQFKRLHSASYTLSSALVAARVEAVNQSRPVVLCSSIDGSACDGGEAWEQGFLSFVDDDKDGRYGSAEAPVAYFPALKTGATIRAHGSFPDRVVFQPNGSAAQGSSFDICIDTHAASGRSIDLRLTGRASARQGASTCPADDAALDTRYLAQE